MSIFSRVGLLGVALAALVSPAARADDAPTGKTYAVIAGAGDFADPAIRPRPAAVQDAVALYDLLRKPEVKGVPAADCHLLLSADAGDRKSQPATRENLLRALADVAAKAKKEDLVILALFGQGASVGQRTCFFTSDSTFKDRANTALVAGAVEAECKKIQAATVLSLLDIHFKGFDAGKEQVAEPKLLDMMRAVLGLKDDEAIVPPGKTVILGSRSLTSLVTPKGGVFGTALAEALAGKADTEGYEADGVVTIEEMSEYLEKRVAEVARNNGKTQEEREQEPYIFPRANRFEVVHNPAAWPAAKARLEKFALVADKLDAEAAAQGRQLLGRMPKLKDLQALRKAYQSLADGALEVDSFLAKRASIIEGMKLPADEASTYATRVLKGVNLVVESYNKEVTPGSLVQTGLKGMYRKADVVPTPEVQKRIDAATDADTDTLETLLVDARTSLGKREDLAGTKDADVTLATALPKLDPYTIYIDADEIKRTESQLKGQFTGIGVQIRRDLSRDGLLVISPILGSPAYARGKGMQAGDLITKIIRTQDDEGNDLNPPEEISTKGMKVDEAVKKILGPAGTGVELDVQREGVAEPIRFKLKRSRIEVESVMGVKRKPDDSWDYMIDPRNQIAYIRLTQFAQKSGLEMAKVMRTLSNQGVKGVVLDLRFNPGGFLNAAVDICDLFIADGTIVRIKSRTRGEQAFTARRAGVDFADGPPLVVLINGESASGSEIVAACLQDNERATIMGSRSYGKGSVQNIQPFPATGAEIKLTTATFWSPLDKNLNKTSTSGKEDDQWGVRPAKAYTIPLPPEEEAELEKSIVEREIIPAKNPAVKKDPPKAVKDRQLEAALEFLRGKTGGEGVRAAAP